MYHHLFLRPQCSEEEPPPQLHIQDRISYRNLVNDSRYSPEDVLQEPEEPTKEEPEEEDNDSEHSEEDD
jgi:hypothetical protein